MRILGIDPGSHRIGYGLIETKPTPPIEGPRCIDCGLIEFRREPQTERLQKTYANIRNILTKNAPEIIGLERIYFSKNVLTAIAVAEARGVILLAAADAHVSVIECSPSAIKASVAGYGAADKTAILIMVKKILHIAEISGPDDVADALAIALAAESIYKQSPVHRSLH